MRAHMPDGWPGLIGIAVLLAGTFVVHREPAMTPLGGFSGTSAGGTAQEVYYASPSGPALALVIGEAGAAHARIDRVLRSLDEDGYAQRHRSVVAIFETAADAEAAAGAVEVDDGVEQLVIDRMLIVFGLPTASDDAPTPVAEVLAASSDVFVEGDRYGEGTIVLDLTCTAPSNETAAAIATALGDYAAVPYYAWLRPPWVGEPLTADEALARATYRRWASAYATSFGNDPWIVEWSDRFIGARSASERTALYEELNAHIAGIDPMLGDDAHPGVVALLSSARAQPDPDGHYRWGRALGQLAGPVPIAAADGEATYFERRHGAQLGSVRASRTRVEIGSATFNSFPLGMTGLLSYLADQRCADVRIALSDFDDVRGD